MESLHYCTDGCVCQSFHAAMYGNLYVVAVRDLLKEESMTVCMDSFEIVAFWAVLRDFPYLCVWILVFHNCIGRVWKTFHTYRYGFLIQRCGQTQSSVAVDPNPTWRLPTRPDMVAANPIQRCGQTQSSAAAKPNPTWRWPTRRCVVPTCGCLGVAVRLRVRRGSGS